LAAVENVQLAWVVGDTVAILARARWRWRQPAASLAARREGWIMPRCGSGSELRPRAAISRSSGCTVKGAIDE
jgi:hypothetical protein